MLKVMIVDDESWAVDELAEILEGYSNIVGKFSDPVAAVEALGGFEPDVVFLDIEMPEMNGFQAATEILTHYPRTGIVFATAYVQYALKAFDLEAIDYLLKPFEAARVLQALQRVEKRFAVEGRYQPLNLTQTVRKGLEDTQQSQIWLWRNGLLVRIPVAHIDVCLIGKTDRYTTVIANGVTYHSSQGLQEFVKQCGENTLKRCHRSCYINPASVCSIRPGKDRTLWIRVADWPEELMVSRQYRQPILDELKVKKSAG